MKKFLPIALLVLLLAAPPAAHADTTSGLVGYWTMNGVDTVWSSATAGTTNDLTGRGSTGTLTNMNQSSTPILGKLGQALKFDGSNDYVDIGNESNFDFESNQPFSIAFWLKPDPSNTGVQIPIAKQSNTAFNGWVIVTNLGNESGVPGDITFALINTAGSNGLETYTTSATSLNNGTWHHYVATYDGSKTPGGMKIYQDGVSLGLSTYANNLTGTILTNIDVNLGSRDTNASSARYQGGMDDVRIYNRVLSATDVTQLYKQGQAKSAVSPTQSVTSGLMGYWTMDGKDTSWGANTTSDLSGQGNTGRMTNLSTTTAPALGKVGQALTFNGSNGYVAIADAASLKPTGAFSISAWIKTSTTFQTIFSSYNQDPTHVWGISFGIDTYTTRAHKLSAVIGDGNSAWLSAYGSTSVDDGKWHYVTITSDGVSTVAIYVDGGANEATVGTDGGSGSFRNLAYTSPNYINIGAEQQGISGVGKFWTGQLDDVRVYNRALSAAQLKQLYKEGVAKLATSPILSLTSGLVGYWTFDGKDTSWSSATAGTTNDLSGSGSTGTLTNMSQRTSPTLGKLGQGFKFASASTQYVNVGSGHYAFTKSTSFSGAMWIKTSSNTMALMSDWTVFSTPGWMFGLGAQNANHLDFEIINANGSAERAIYGNSTPNDGKWHHVAFTYDGSQDVSGEKLYVDGVLETPTTILNTDPGTLVDTGFTIGERAGSSLPYNGAMDDVRVYNRALSAAEILQLYKLGGATTR